MPSIQPSGLTSDHGCILTIGVVSESERSTMVIPFCTESSVLDDTNRCYDLVVSFDGSSLSDFQACMSSSAYVSFISAEGMKDGSVPFRLDYPPTDKVGSRAANCQSNQIAGLIAYYEDPADATPGQRMRVAKTFVPGLSVADFSTGAMILALQTALQTVGDNTIAGFASLNDGSSNWYRVLAAPKPRNTTNPVRRTVTAIGRGYTGTQRRRLLPH